MLQIKMKKWTGYLLVMLCLAMSAAVGVSAPLPAGKDEVVMPILPPTVQWK